MSREELVAEFQDDARDAYEAKEEELGPELMREIERYLVLQVVDVRWREHLEAMEYLREGIHLRAMAQKDPLVEYRGEGHAMFEELGQMIHEEVVRYLFHVELAPDEAEGLHPEAHDDNLVYEHESVCGLGRDLGGRQLGERLRRLGAARGSGHHAAARRERVGQGGPQRSVSLRVGEEVQEVPRVDGVDGVAMAERAAIESDLEEIRAQLAWVRDYL